MSTSEHASPDETATVGLPGLEDELPPAPTHDRAGTGGLWAGMELGRFIVLGELGRGGMGIVLHAYDPKLEREVALKLVRTDALDEAAQARLVAEARAMAQLAHPNVVVVHDVETLSAPEVGSVVALIMEYVPGQTLATWVKAHRRTWQQVVDVYVAAGRGLAAAHARQMLHRDFKPANVLLDAASDDRSAPSRVKVTDFGLAKQQAGPLSAASNASLVDSDTALLDGSSAEHSIDPLTRAGVLLGTPRYMAPEQHRGASLDAAADQYAFCVALWESLCGKPPFAGRSMVHAKEGGPPPWPSEASAPTRVRKVVARGMAPNPRDRWPSMDALLVALQARPHRRWIAVAGVGVVAGVAAFAWLREDQRCTGARDRLAGAWDDAQREAVQSAMLGTDLPFAPRSLERVATQLDAYADTWAVMHEEACVATTIRGEQSAAVLDLRMACLDRARVALAATTDVLAHADAAVVAKSHELLAELPTLDACARIDELVHDQVEPPPPGEAEAVARVQPIVSRARSLIATGRFTDAEAALEQAQTLVATLSYGPAHTEVTALRGNLRAAQALTEEAVLAYREALGAAVVHRQWALAREASTELMLLLGHRLGRAEQALEHRSIAEALAEGDPYARAEVHQSVALTLETAGNYAEAEAEQRKALALTESLAGPDAWETMLRKTNLAYVLTSAGRFDESQKLYEEALAVGVPELGESHPSIGNIHDNYGTALAFGGKYEASAAEHHRAYEVGVATYGPDHPRTVGALANEGAALLWAGKLREAEAPLAGALELWERTKPEHHEISNIRNNYAVLLWKDGRLAEAEAQMHQVLQTRRRVLGDDHPDNAAAMTNLSAILAEQGKYAEAAEVGRDALRLLTARVDPEHPQIAYARTNLAAALLQLGEDTEARALLEAAWERLNRPSIAAESRAEVALLLAQASWARAEDRARARALANVAVEAYAEAGEGYADKRAVAQTWLSDHPAP